MDYCRTRSLLTASLLLGCSARLLTAQVASAPVSQGTLSLEQAIERAEANEPAFVAAAAERRALLLERRDARAAFLPKAIYHAQALYTEPNGRDDRIGQTANQPSPVFLANNSVREYANQGVLGETVGLAQIGAIRLADANAALATAELEVARRGLVATVVNLFYGVGAGADRLRIAMSALDEANRFVNETEKREAARESAHADVIKAELQQQQRQRELTDLKLAAEKAKIELAVLLFPDPTASYRLSPTDAPAPLPEKAAIEAAARLNNPELRSALATIQISLGNTYAARAALFPELNINLTYGIDAPQFAKGGPDNTRNLGYSFGATLDVPVFDWLTTERRIKESRIRADAAKTVLTAAQRRLIADLSEFYAEASTAQTQLASLDRSVLGARESLRLTNLRYADGESTVFEVIDAQNTLISAENAQLDGLVRYQLSLAQLQTLTGKL